MINRYHEHLDYQQYGAGVDKVGYDNFNSKAYLILFMVLVVIVIDVVLITKKRNERKKLIS
jgi:hypothetical protein